MKYSATNEPVRISQTSSSNCNFITEGTNIVKPNYYEVRLSVESQLKELPKIDSERQAEEDIVKIIPDHKE